VDVLPMSKENIIFLWLLEKKNILENFDPTTFSFLFFCLEVSWTEKVVQQPSILSMQEGDCSKINCTYSDTASDSFPGSPSRNLQRVPCLLIIDICSNRLSNQKQRLMILLNNKDKQFLLHIEGTQPGESAVYFSAARVHGFAGTYNLSSNLPLGLQPYPCPLL
jgi:hypothetical protein